MGLTEEQAVAEARRCLQCSVCCECRACEEACEQIGAINHFSMPKQLTLSCPSVIVADESELPDASLLQEDADVHRVVDLQHDLMDVMISGSVAAGRAMAAASRLRAPAVPYEKDVQDMSDEVRIGFFLCTCNDTMASRSALERVQKLFERAPGVVHSELIVSACHPRGADLIAETMKRKGLTRVVLASCVCCPLEFQCNSCNDQRTRARIHLFERLGLPRSRFETINLRDHLSAHHMDDDAVVEKARDLLRASFLRARYMGPLTQGTTRIGKNVLILGGGDIGRSCAMNLDLQGFRVRLVHNPRVDGQEHDGRPHPLPPPEEGRKIIHVESAAIRDIRGHMGDFTILAREGDANRRWRADIVCLVDASVLSLALDENTDGLKKLYRYDFAFFHTPQAGLFRVQPQTLERVREFEAGAALAAQVARGAAEAFLKDHMLSPQVDPERCRGCGRCEEICPFNAISLVPGVAGIYTAEVVRHNCVGCGACVGRCPVMALDMPYFSNRVLEALVTDAMTGGKE
jgi:heterodisulfide reductase subunit A-like polyferredoxin